MWAAEHSGVVPDVLCIGKGIAGGLPMGVTLGKAEVLEGFVRGEHTSTFGGNPLVCAAASATIDVLRGADLLEQVQQRGVNFLEGLRALAAGSRLVREARGIGLMLALELRQDFRPSLLRAVEQGLLLLYSGYTILRLLPPLVVTTEQVERALGILRRVLQSDAPEVPAHQQPSAS
jgi:acetylornithine/LysW-gamma-L-lysine aminotransferase